MNITVYCGSGTGKDPVYKEKACEFGRWIGGNGHRLIYGGGGTGLMGAVADSVLEAGGEVTGVMPHFLVEREAAHSALTRLITVDTMTERKAKMVELGDVFVALPGGPGTMEEISEVISLIRLRKLESIGILYSAAGYYRPLKDMFEQMVREGFIYDEITEFVKFPETFDELRRIIEGFKVE
jgi:uncharacterized protein (TIGR00730 family)